MSLWEELRKGVAQAIDPLGIGFPGVDQAIAGKDNYEPLIDLGSTGTQLARMVALAVASYFTFGGAAAAAPASSGAGATAAGGGTVATTAGAGATTTTAGATAASGAAATGSTTAATTAAAAPSVSAPAVAAAPTTTAGSGLFTADNAMRAAGYLSMMGSARGGSAPDVAAPAPYRRAPQPNGVPANPQPSNYNRPTDTMGGTLATSPQGVSGQASVTPRLGTRRLLG